MEPLLDELCAWGCAVDRTLQNLGNDTGLYVKCVRLFALDENFDALARCMRKHDRVGAFEAVHTIKGVTGNLGLTPLFESSCALTDLLREGREITDGARVESLAGDLDVLYAQFKEIVEAHP